MKVNELMMSISNDGFNMKQELQVKKYLPIEEKKLIAKGIIYECTERINGAIKVDSVQKHLSYVKYMILRHTNLEYINEDYDTLCSSGLLDEIIACFDQDAKECARILDLIMDDYMQENSMEFIVAKFLYGLNDMVGSLAEKLNDKIEDMGLGTMIPSDMDKGKLVNFLNTYVK